MLFVFFPLCIFHWRGTWHLQDVFIYPSNYKLSSCISLGYGSILGVLLTWLHPSLAAWLHCKHRVIYAIGIRIYLYINAWAILGFWRGLWNLVDVYLTEDWLNSVILYSIATVVSAAFRSTRTNAGIPLAVQVDSDSELLKPDTVLNIKVQLQHLNWSFGELCIKRDVR